MGTWSFGYDPLNRLTSATTTKSISNGNYDYCWTYDQYGNRTGQFGSNEAFVVGSPTCQPAPTPGTLTTNTATYNASNQMTQTNAPGTTVQPSYDPTGDITNDGSNQYVYDAEGRVCAVYQIPIGGVTNGWTGYVYDAAGNRVGKGNITNWNGTCDTTTNGFVLTSQYLLGPSGEQMTELNATGAWVHTNVMANGSLIATFDNDNQGAHFYLTDWLGTRRVQTNYIGAMENTWTSLPYGDALAPSNNLDPTEQHFTGKERDTESGNDYMFARYYNSATGRFLSPDWDAKSSDPVPYAKLDDPQSLNLYSYVRNNPLSRTDPDGHVDDEKKKKHHHVVRKPPEQTQQQKTEVGYGETSGLLPARNPNAPAPANGKKENPYDPATWDKTSAEQLQKARENVIDISGKNPNVHKATAGSNPIEQEIWNLNADAAKNSDGSSPGKYFFIRQDAPGDPQHPSPRAGYGQGDPIQTYGPFRNVGGGDVPRGDKTFIDIYDK